MDTWLTFCRRAEQAKHMFMDSLFDPEDSSSAESDGNIPHHVRDGPDDWRAEEAEQWSRALSNEQAVQRTQRKAARALNASSQRARLQELILLHPIPSLSNQSHRIPSYPAPPCPTLPSHTHLF